MRAFWLLLFCVGAVAAKSWTDKLFPDWFLRWKYKRLECEQKPFVTGVCRAYFKRYSYNWKKGKCEPFIYGGCKGTKNNFEKREICEAMCSSRVPIKCLHCRREEEKPKKVEICVSKCIKKTAKGKTKDVKKTDKENKEMSNFLEEK